MEFGCSGSFAVGFFHGGEDSPVGAGDENVVARIFLLEHGADDFGNLLRRFAFGKDNFGKALTESAVMIDFSEAEVLKRQVLEPFNGRAGREFSALHRFQNFQ